MKNRKIYYLCPECLALLDHFLTVYLEKSTYVMYPVESGGQVVEDFSEQLESETIDVDGAVCPNCSAFFENRASGDFLVEMNGDEFIPAGTYWAENKDILNRMKKNEVVELQGW